MAGEGGTRDVAAQAGRQGPGIMEPDLMHHERKELDFSCRRSGNL